MLIADYVQNTDVDYTRKFIWMSKKSERKKKKNVK